MPAAQELELACGCEIARGTVLCCHHGAVFAHLDLVIHVLLRESVRLLVEEKGGNCMRRERQLAELLAQMHESILLVEYTIPFGRGQGSGLGSHGSLVKCMTS